jgi:hypothetical protein
MYELHDTSSATGCTCHECNADKTYNGLPWASCVMIVCADCGNKRCPKATRPQERMHQQQRTRAAWLAVSALNC